GEALAVLDSIELGEARAAYLGARARHEVAARELDRERSLAAERIATEREVLAAEASAREAAADLAAGRERLELLGLSAREIAALTWDDPGASRVSVRAPFAGRVVAKEATRGELVTPERNLFTVADLSRVWVWLDVYERDLRHVHPGERVEATFEAWPGETFRGEIAYVADQVDPATRTVRARVDLPNPDGRLKPGMFATVEIAGSGGEEAAPALAVPRAAVQRDGEGSILFVRTGPGRFERREVEIGRLGDEHAEVLAGVAPGEEVVVRGAFLLRSQAAGDELGGGHHH
ncbi:MAG TPA: efflux RND transporter periplasmic adaptor subunit, partial [Thermoanaerobaculia bacterium]|nr:efflux RND transporter periplasmic adaptor subunit [Thermoanaerobaculia bacterium]